ncbi:hypothetical protein [Histophilus somni]
MLAKIDNNLNIFSSSFLLHKISVKRIFNTIFFKKK